MTYLSYALLSRMEGIIGKAEKQGHDFTMGEGGGGVAIASSPNDCHYVVL